MVLLLMMKMTMTMINLLHDGGEERLRVEESGEPDGGRQLEVPGPRLQFFNPL